MNMARKRKSGVTEGEMCRVCEGTLRYTKSNKCVGCVSRNNNKKKYEEGLPNDFDKWHRFWFEIHEGY